MKNKIKILTVFGTRPEVIKLAPFIKAVEMDGECISITCATTQQRDLQQDVLTLFDLKPDYDLDVMEQDQALTQVTQKVLKNIDPLLINEKPDFLVVQGDTTSAFSAALAAFYKKIPIIHLEAGLRTNNIYAPYPEEANRSLIARIATLHMAPTQEALDNLKSEGIVKNVFNTGNTIVDSVDWTLKTCQPQNRWLKENLMSSSDKVLITIHRRENFGRPLENICAAIKHLCETSSHCLFIWPLHPNPNIKNRVQETLKGIPNLYLIDPLFYSDLLLLIKSCRIILSDSGGIQEEAYILQKQIIIVRENTERPEIVQSGFGVLVGNDQEKICQTFKDFMNANLFSKHTFASKDIYGTPGVTYKILNQIKSYYKTRGN